MEEKIKLVLLIILIGIVYWALINPIGDKVDEFLEHRRYKKELKDKSN